VQSSFEESVARFQQFLKEVGYPTTVLWVKPDDVILTDRRLIYVKQSVSKKNESDAQQAYGLGINRKLGVLFCALCSTDEITYAYVWVPTDELDAQRALMPRDLKLSAATGADRIRGMVVRSRLLSACLSMRYRSKQKWKDQLFR
jgi:hypothetical protein